MKTHKPKTKKAICSAVAFLTLVLTALSTTQSVRATVLDLSGLDGNYSASGTWFSGDGGTGANHNDTGGRFINPNGGGLNSAGGPILSASISSLAGASTIYYGGTVNVSGLTTGAGDWNAGGGGGDVTFAFGGDRNGGWDLWNGLSTTSDKGAGTWGGASVGSNWNLYGGDFATFSNNDSGQAIGGGPLDFVIGLTPGSGANGHTDILSVWYGVNADAATQGAADFTFTGSAWHNAFTGGVPLVGLNAWVPAGGSVTTSHMFASDSWHAVQGGSGPAPSPVPEPSTYGMLFFGITGLLLVARMRGSCRI
jgi:hypothetical protein